MRTVLNFLAGMAIGAGLWSLLAAERVPSASGVDLVADAERAALEARIRALVAELEGPRRGPGLVGGAGGDGGPGPSGIASASESAADVDGVVNEAVDALLGFRADDAKGLAMLQGTWGALQGAGPAAAEALRARVVDAARSPEERARALDLLHALDPARAALLAAMMLDPPPLAPALLASVLAAADADVVGARSAALQDLAERTDLDLDVRYLAARAWMASGSDAAISQVEAWLSAADDERALATRVLEALPSTMPAARELQRRSLFQEGLLDRATQGRIMGNLAAAQGAAWSAQQLVGPPDTAFGGDHRSAWASKRPEMGRVDLELTFDVAVRPTAVRIHETFQPGAVAAVEIPDGRGGWAPVWTGSAPPGSAPRWFEPPLAEVRTAVRRLRIVLDTDRVSGWNEIDAVEMIGDGRRQWVAEAWASSSYAE